MSLRAQLLAKLRDAVREARGEFAWNALEYNLGLAYDAGALAASEDARVRAAMEGAQCMGPRRPATTESRRCASGADRSVVAHGPGATSV